MDLTLAASRSDVVSEDDLSVPDAFVAGDTSMIREHPLLVVAVVVAWIAMGQVIAARTAPDERARRPLAALGVFFGPLLWTYVRNAFRPHRTDRELVLAEAHEHEGSTRVVVAVLGAPEDAADVAGILSMVGGEVASVDLVAPVTPTAVDDVADPDHRAALDRLWQAAPFLDHVAPGMRLIPGHGVAAVAAHLHQHPADLVLVTGAPEAQAELARLGAGRTVAAALPTPAAAIR